MYKLHDLFWFGKLRNKLFTYCPSLVMVICHYWRKIAGLAAIAEPPSGGHGNFALIHLIRGEWGRRRSWIRHMPAARSHCGGRLTVVNRNNEDHLASHKALNYAVFKEYSSEENYNINSTYINHGAVMAGQFPRKSTQKIPLSSPTQCSFVNLYSDFCSSPL